MTDVPTNANTIQVYVRDTVAATTRLVSANAAGVASTDGATRPSISGDGQWLAYSSNSVNLVPGVTDGNTHAFLWSMRTGQTIAVGVTESVGHPIGNGDELYVSVSRDGSKVAFESSSTNLTSDDARGRTQIYVRDIVAESTQMISVQSPGMGSATGAHKPEISADGHSVAFLSDSNLTASDARHHLQAYVRNLAAGETRMISIAIDGATGADRDVGDLSLSANGNLAGFTSAAVNLTTGASAGKQVTYLRDITSDTTTTFLGGRAGIITPRVSADGHHLVFSSTERITRDGSEFTAVERVYSTDLRSEESILISTPLSGIAGRYDDFSVYPTASEDGQFVAFTSRMTNLTPETATSTLQVYIRNATAESRIDRIGGADRYDVSAATSAAAFPPEVDYAFVASGAVFSDALSASAAAGLRHAPVLLTEHDFVPVAVQAELTRLNPGHIILLGGTDTITPAVEAQLKPFSSRGDVVRVAGADRYQVSAALSQMTFPTRPATAYVASGEVFPDALSGSAAAGHSSGPVLLVNKNAIPAAVDAELRRLTPAKIVVLGGANTVADAVVASLGGIAPTTRIAGADRFAVSAAVSSSAFVANTSTVYVASGLVFPDALSGSAAAIYRGSPVLLVTKDGVPDLVAAELRRLNPHRIVVLGGTATVSDANFAALRSYLAP
ncbi:cell wall-binding repeat-containing protein [Herbiconiux sp.]|uniref:cell wall-binding repeat-containing protein n=1 Tax=Herbiconiux sp. TaxID=1871186 RepID=UPI0025BDD82C|nr:cell wall-binding repeat-containing protein [Herbiconiux sp.]